MNRLLKLFLERTIKHGALEVVDPQGKLHRFGDASPVGVRVRFASSSVERSILLNAQLRLGEAFMDGGVTVEAGSIYDFIALVVSNDSNPRPSWVARFISRSRHLTRRLRTLNTVTRARQNVAHHYDLDHRLYSLFLDADMQYSCAYFESPDVGIDEAQAAKKRHLGRKLLLEPGMRVLDIGCGYGGLGLYLAETYNVDVTGVTLSTEQLAIANRRAAERGLEQKARFLLEDYRKVAGTFDRIVSVGMFEHVGVSSYKLFFDRCYDMLTPDGLLVLHSVVRLFGPVQTNAWVEKYIFPGGASPALSDVAPVIEKSGFVLSDIEFLRLHYAETLKAWRLRFMANREAARALYDERFCRMWEFYLAGFEAAFRFDDLAVFQLQLGKRLATVPTTRNYLYS